MDRHKIEQEQYCLQAKALCDALRTKLYLINDFKSREYFNKKLKQIKKEVDEIYWEL